ncbi:unnamed protein product [Ectocarpus sp. 8 AP-2014]
MSRCVVLLNHSGVCCGQQRSWKKLADAFTRPPFVFDRYNNKHDGAFLGYLPEKNAGVYYQDGTQLSLGQGRKKSFARRSAPLFSRVFRCLPGMLCATSIQGFVGCFNS